jgi:NADH:ubiquinone oxidoreductase subunit 2 (subunit N)
MYALLFIGALNSVLSLFYYVKVLKVMALEKPLEEVEGRPAAPVRVPLAATVFAGLMAVALLVLGILWDPLAYQSDRGVGQFRQLPGMGPGGVLAQREQR